MELCTARGVISNLLMQKVTPRPQFASCHVRSFRQRGSHFPVVLKQTHINYGLWHRGITCVSSSTETTTFEPITSEETTPETTTAEETTTDITSAEVTPCEETTTDGTTVGATAYEETTTDITSAEVTPCEETTADGTTVGATAYEETKPEATSNMKSEPEADSVVVVKVEEPPSIVKKDEYINQPNEAPQDSSFDFDSLQLSKILDDLNLKFDSEEKYSYLALGGGALIALWISAAVLRAIDSVPVLPKVLELVGLGYTLWFSSRYLFFEQNREELACKVKEFKKEVFGSEDD